MKNWVVVAQMNGYYINVNESGEDDVKTVGPTFFLGVEKGNTISDAAKSIIEKHDLKMKMPDIVNAQIYGYQTLGSSKDVSLNKALREDKIQEDKDRVKCEWCNKETSNKGAARFSHLKKHVKQLEDAGILSRDQALNIRSLKLDSSIRKIFSKHKKLLKG